MGRGASGQYKKLKSIGGKETNISVWGGILGKDLPRPLTRRAKRGRQGHTHDTLRYVVLISSLVPVRRNASCVLYSVHIHNPNPCQAGTVDCLGERFLSTPLLFPSRVTGVYWCSPRSYGADPGGNSTGASFQYQRIFFLELVLPQRRRAGSCLIFKLVC